MISKAILNFSLIFAFLTFLSCTKNSAPSQVNESAIKIKTTPETDSNSEQEQSFFDLNITYSDLAKTNSSEVYEKIVRPISKYILNLESLNNKKISTSEKAFELLRVLNKAILKIHVEAKNSANDQAILSLYEQILYSGCDANLSGCEKISFFSRDPQSSQIAGLIAAAKKDSHEFFTQMLVAFELANKIEHPELNRLYLSRFSELHTELLNLKQKSPNLYGHHISVLHLLIQSGSADELKSLSSWNIDLSQNSELVAFGDDLQRIKFSNKLYEKDDLTPSLKSEIASTQLLPGSFSELETQVIDHNINLAKTLKLEKIRNKNEYFYIVDQLFQEKLSLDDAVSFWTNSKQDLNQIASIARAYNQIQFAKLIIDSNQKMKVFFENPDQITNQKVQDAIRSAPNVALLSENYQKRIKNISDFLKLLLNQQRLTLKTSPELDALKSLDSLLSNIKYNIRVNISYPHMIFTAYYIIQRKFSVEVRGHGEKIDSTDLYKNIFGARMNLWFDYGTNEPDSPADHSVQLSPIEILSATNAGIYNETLKSFSISPDEFFKLLIENLISPDINSDAIMHFKMSDNLNYVHQTFNSSDWQHLLAICETFTKPGAVVRELNFTELSDSPAFGKEIALFTRSVDDQNRSLAGYHLFSGRMLRELENIRTVVGPNINFIRFLIDSYRNYLRNIGDQDATHSLPISEQKLNQFEAQVQNYILELEAYRAQLQKCLYPLLKFESETQIKLVGYEIEHLRQIHRDMKKLKLHPELSQSLNQKDAFKTPLKTAQAKDNFTADAFNYSQFDFLMRLKDYYEIGIQTESAKKPPVNTSVRINLPLNFRFDSIYMASKSYQILYRENEDEFVNAALQAALSQPGSNSSFVGWFKFTARLFTVPDNLLGLISLYRLNSILPASTTTPKIGLADIIDMTRQQLDCLKLSDGEKDILVRLGLTNRYAREFGSIEGLYFDHKSFTTLPFFDRSFEYLFEKNLAEVITQSHEETATIDSNQDSKPTFEYATLLTDSIVRRGAGIFEINQILDLDLKTYYTKQLKSEYDSANQFEALAHQEYEKDRAAKKIMNLDIDLEIKFTPPPTYISDYELNNLKGFIKNFKTKTGNYYNFEN